MIKIKHDLSVLTNVAFRRWPFIATYEGDDVVLRGAPLPIEGVHFPSMHKAYIYTLKLIEEDLKRVVARAEADTYESRML